MICLYAADGKQVSSILVDRCCPTNSGINLAANIMMAADTTKTATSLLRLRLSGILACLPMKPLSSLLALGVWVLGGIGVAGAVVSVVSGAICAVIKAGMYFLAQVLS